MGDLGVPENMFYKKQKREQDKKVEKDTNLFPRRRIDYLNAIFPLKWLNVWRRQKFGSRGERGEVVLEGIYYGEGPRVHNGALYFSDMHHKKVIKIDINSFETLHTILFDDLVSGIGFLPDGRMLVVGMENQNLLVHDEEK